jgi:tetratricopeptide (TPR) repeat protein
MYIVVRGAINYALGDFDVAIADFSRVLETDAENAEAYQQRSLALTQLSRFGEALEDLDKYCSMRPDDLGVIWVADEAAAANIFNNHSFSPKQENHIFARASE